MGYTRFISNPANAIQFMNTVANVLQLRSQDVTISYYFGQVKDSLESPSPLFNHTHAHTHTHLRRTLACALVRNTFCCTSSRSTSHARTLSFRLWFLYFSMKMQKHTPALQSHWTYVYMHMHLHKQSRNDGRRLIYNVGYLHHRLFHPLSVL